MAIATAAKEIIARRHRQSRSAAGSKSISLVQNDKRNRFRGQDPWLVEHVPATLHDRCWRPPRSSPSATASRARRRTTTRCSRSSARPQAQAAGRFDDEIVPMTTTMAVPDKATGADLEARDHARQGRGQPARRRGSRTSPKLKPVFKDGQRDQGGPLHHGRQRLAALGRRLGLRADGGQARPSAAACSRSAPIAAWRSPAATRTRWASARSSPCRSS